MAVISLLENVIKRWYNQMVVGSADVGMLDGVGNNSQQCKDVQCIMGRIRPIRLCELTKFDKKLVFNVLVHAYLHEEHI